jgi:DNA-binding transcriptional MerR regulator
MAKSRDAFRTISEVSEWLETPAHVLRFWETRFAQIKPVKRAGGRRYYRPEDMALLAGIKALLHDQGMTIKGVQKMLREQGVRHVAGLGPQKIDDDAMTLDAGRATQAASEADTSADEADRIAAEMSASTTPLHAVASSAGFPNPEGAARQGEQEHDAAAVASVAAQSSLLPMDEGEGPAAMVSPPDAETPTEPAPSEPDLPPATPTMTEAVRLLLESLPDPDAEAAPVSARFFEPLYRADPSVIRSRAAQFAPLLHRLESLRDRISREAS